MQTALLVYSHPDDEIIFGYPFLFDPDVHCRILICSCDENNKARSWCRKQRAAFGAVCKLCGVSNYRMLDFHSEFSRLPSRAKNGLLLKDWWNAATTSLREMSKGCDFVATHNPWGEYGHLDHLLVRRMVRESGTHLPLRCTTAYYQTKTWPIGEAVYKADETSADIELDTERYEKLKHEYDTRGCFTWDNPVPTPVRIIETR